MRVLGGVPRAPSILESSRPALRRVRTRGTTGPLLPSSGTPATLLSIGGQNRDYPSLTNIHTRWYTRLSATAWATSRLTDVGRSGSRHPNADCRTGVFLGVRGLRIPACPAWGRSFVPNSFRYSTSRYCFLDTVPFISQSAVPSAVCPGVELGIPAVKRWRGVSTVREEEALRQTSMSVPIENYRYYRDSHKDNPLPR